MDLWQLDQIRDLYLKAVFQSRLSQNRSGLFNIGSDRNHDVATAKKSTGGRIGRSCHVFRLLLLYFDVDYRIYESNYNMPYLYRSYHHYLTVTSAIAVFGVNLISALTFASFSKMSESNSFVNNDQFSPRSCCITKICFPERSVL